MLSKDYVIPADGTTEKYLFDAMNHYDEVYETDTLFSNVNANYGSNCAHIYCGKKSSFTHVFGMKTKSEMTDTFMNFICTFGVMKGLFSDNNRVWTGASVKDILWQ